MREWFETPVGDNGGQFRCAPQEMLAHWVKVTLNGDDVVLSQFIVRNGRMYFLPGWSVWKLDGSTAIETLAKLIENQEEQQ